MKILLLSPKPPFPSRDGSSLATAQVIEGLAGRGHEIHVFFLNTSKHSSSQQDLPQQDRIFFHPATCNTSVKPLPALSSLLFSSVPYTVSRFITKDTVRALKRLLAEETFDIIQIEGLMMTPYLDLLPENSQIRVVFRPHNTEYLIWSHLAEKERNPLKKKYFSLLAQQIKKYEQHIAGRFRYILPISEKDASIFASWNPRASRMVLPYGIDLPEETARKDAGLPGLLFLGALDWRPNIQGLEWFLEEVWPALSQQVPDLIFHIAGRNPDPALKNKIERFNKEGKITFYGEVARTAGLFARASLFIVPLFAGSGIRIKILEAMSQGLVVISTSTGAAGLPLENNREILIADTPEQFLRAIGKTAKDPQFCSTIRENALHLLKKRFDRKHLISELEKFYLKA